MEFYKLFHKRTNYHEMLEWVDRGFRPEIYEKRDKAFRNSLLQLMMPYAIVNGIMNEHAKP